MEKVTKKEFTKGAVWRMLGSIAAKGVSFVVTIVLARIILPSNYGIIAIATAFINLSDIFIEGGFTTALVRKKDVDDYDYTSVFLTSLLISFVLYLALFISAPFIANYYEEELLRPVLRVIGVMFFIQAFACTRNIYVQRHMKFKLLSICNIVGSVISGVAGIIAAYCGLEVWALVIQQLVQQALITLLLFFFVKIKFKWGFKWNSIKETFKFSAGVMGASLLNYGSSYLSNFFIGKIYSVEDLGYSDKGGQLPMQVSLYTFGSMSGVLLPALASYQEELDNFKIVFRKVVRMTAFFILPMMAGMAIVARELIIVLLTDTWLPALRILQYSCIYYFATPFMLINISVFYSLGHKYIRIRSEIIRFILIMSGLLIFGIALHFTINQLILVNAIIAVLSALETYFEVRRLIKYSFKEVVQDFWKPTLACLVMAGGTIGVRYLLLYVGLPSNILILLISVLTGVILYFVGVILLRTDSYYELKATVMNKFSKKDKNVADTSVIENNEPIIENDSVAKDDNQNLEQKSSDTIDEVDKEQKNE